MGNNTSMIVSPQDRFAMGKAAASSDDNIVLIGMPGAGKSTLGIVLAKILAYDFLDTDLVIQNRCDKTLQKLIDACGSEAFIEIENEILKDLSVNRTVISTGGSAVYSSKAMRHLASLGTIVYLKISYDSMICRIQNLPERGVVFRNENAMSMQELYNEREPLYEKYADVIVNVDNLDIASAARKIAESIQE